VSEPERSESSSDDSGLRLLERLGVRSTLQRRAGVGVRVFDLDLLLLRDLEYDLDLDLCDRLRDRLRDLDRDRDLEYDLERDLLLDLLGVLSRFGLAMGT